MSCHSPPGHSLPCAQNRICWLAASLPTNLGDPSLKAPYLACLPLPSSCSDDIPSVNVTASVQNDAVHGRWRQTVIPSPLLWYSQIYPSTARQFLTVTPQSNPSPSIYALIMADSSTGYPPLCDPHRWDIITCIPHLSMCISSLGEKSLVFLGRPNGYKVLW